MADFADSYANQALSKEREGIKESIIKNTSTLLLHSEFHRQNLNGRETDYELFVLGTEAMHEEIVLFLKDLTNKK